MRATGLRIWVCGCVLLTILSSLLGADAQQGHRIAGSQIHIDRRSHWQAWEGAAGVVNVAPNGAVSPIYIRKNVNASLNAANFSLAGAGGVVAISNEAESANLIDGDMTTTWGPDPDSHIGDWSVTINLVTCPHICIHIQS